MGLSTGMKGVLKAPVGWVPVRLVDTLMFIVRGSTERREDPRCRRRDRGRKKQQEQQWGLRCHEASQRRQGGAFLEEGAKVSRRG